MLDAKLHHSCGDGVRLHPCTDMCIWFEHAGTHIILLHQQHEWKCRIWSVQPLLTFSNNLLNSDLVSPDSEGSSNEISACMTGPGAATSSSRTRPGADQLPTRIKELPHVVEMTGWVFADSDKRRTDELLVSCALNYCTDR